VLTPVPSPVIAEDGKTDTPIHLVKGKDGVTGYKLAVASYFYKDVEGIIGAPASTYTLLFYLDKEEHTDYARLLLPKTVGYSAGLIDWFFRGKIEIQIPDEGAYALITSEPGNPHTTGFNHIKLKAKNVSDNNEEMTKGDIQLVVKYRLSEGTPFVDTIDEISATSDNFYYITATESNGVRTIPRNSFANLDFQLPSDIPLWATDVYFYVVYKGDLGSEKNNAVCVGYKDVSEPTPIGFINDQDHICLNSTLYIAGSAAAIDVVDSNDNGIADEWEWDVYPHKLQDIFIRFSPNDNPQYPIFEASEYNPLIPYIDKGHYVRFYAITDYTLTYSHSSFWMVKIDPNDHIEDSYYDPEILQNEVAVKNQFIYPDENACTSYGLAYPCIIRSVELMSDHRGLLAQAGEYFVYSDYPDGGNDNCSYDEASPDVILQSSGLSLFSLLPGLGNGSVKKHYNNSRMITTIDNETTLIQDNTNNGCIVTKHKDTQALRKRSSVRKNQK
jgi:hypothetical protein